MSLFNRHKPKVPALRVRLQHEALDNAAIEGLWVGTYDGYLHLRAAKTILEGEAKPIPHEEILVPDRRIVFIEVLNGAVTVHPDSLRLPGDRDS